MRLYCFHVYSFVYASICMYVHTHASACAVNISYACLYVLDCMHICINQHLMHTLTHMYINKDQRYEVFIF